MNHFLKILLFIIIFTVSQPSLSGNLSMESNKNTKDILTNTILEVAKENDIKDITIRFHEDNSGNLVATLLSNHKERKIFFSEEEVKAIEQNKVLKNTNDKIKATINLLDNTGCPGPGIKK